MKIKGVSCETAWKKRVAVRYADQRARMLDLQSLRRAKRATGRPQDLLDLEALRAAKSQPRRPR